MIEKLYQRIWNHDVFHKEAVMLQSQCMVKRYIKESHTTVDISEDILSRLLQCAVTLSGSKDKLHREAAYRIVASAAELTGEVLSGVPYLMLLALGRIGNFPAADFAKKHYRISEESFPVRQLFETVGRRQGNSIKLGGSVSVLTDFQLLLWKNLNDYQTIGISAPTSAGKSFVLQGHARELLSVGKTNNVVFLVPTRALINQVSGEVSNWLPGLPNGIELVTTPIPREAQLPMKAVYVVTQERLQLLLTSHEELVFDLMLVDEAQSIADGPRGVLLSSVIETALDRNHQMQLLFAGANIKDPGAISIIFDREQQTVSTDESPVLQNILFVDCIPEKPRAAKLSLKTDREFIPLGELDCEQPLVDHNSKLINIALRLGQGGQNLLYALGPAEAEKIAFGISDAIEVQTDDFLTELSIFIKDAVHPKFQLSNDVMKSVGYHYGRLPTLVRKAIEDAFSNGKLRYLATTSTLLHGVNMPARNLFMHKPQRGKGQPLTSTDFWNLAGRAGRLGKEFSGNIFLIDYRSWDNDPISGPKEKEIIPAFEQHVRYETEQLLSYMNDPEIVPDRDKPDEYENTFVKLVKDYLEGTLDRTLSRLDVSEETGERKAIIDSIERAVENKSITKQVLTQSPTVSVHRQQSLYDWITSSLRKRGAAYVIPKFPRDSASYTSYLACIKRCHGAILKYNKSDNSHKYYALIARRWMLGNPLPQIIDDSFKYKIKNGLNPNIATIIRETLNEIEQNLRFKYVRLFSCYNAVLEQVLHDNDLGELVRSIPAIPMYLEVGACSPSMISFMGLGLSRYTAGKLQSLPRRQDMSQHDARNWIRNQDIESLNVPMASIDEIKRLGRAA